MDVLYVDNHLLALNKPAGLLTQPSGTSEDNLEDRAKAWVKAEYHKPGAVFLEAVHRIDRPVAGVVLFARTSKALSRLNEAMRRGDCEKIYLALVTGDLPGPDGALNDWLLHGDHRADVVPAGTPGAKAAVLTYTVLRRSAGRSLLRIVLGSGRYHQIRAQLAQAGCPIVGDHKYGSPERWLSADGIALQHATLRICHPVTREAMVFTAPDIFTAAL
ncbi:MAG: RNA pseudouridine synthase [Lentisphaerae bacterium]|nr:RNA pseudouridine synthase [Lentisphaerota bacterium]